VPLPLAGACARRALAGNPLGERGGMRREHRRAMGLGLLTSGLASALLGSGHVHLLVGSPHGQCLQPDSSTFQAALPKEIVRSSVGAIRTHPQIRGL